MAADSLTTQTSLQCPHGGQVQIVSSNTSVKAGGVALALATDTFVVSGCPFQIPATPPIPSPCMKVMWILPDLRVKVGAQATLNRSDSGLCVSAAQVPQGPVSVVTTQARVKTE